MTLPCSVRHPPFCHFSTDDRNFSWDVPEGNLGIIRGPKAQAFAAEKRLDIDFTSRSTLARVITDMPNQLYHADLDLPGAICGQDEHLPKPPPIPRFVKDEGWEVFSKKMEAYQKDREAFQKTQRFTVVALVVESDAETLLAQAYLDLTGKNIPIFDLRGVDLIQKQALAHRSLCGFLSRYLTQDTFIPHFRIEDTPEAKECAEDATRYYGAPFMPVSMEWPLWRWEENTGPYLFHSQYRVSDLPDPVRACLPPGVTSLLIFVNPIIDVWPSVPDNPPFHVCFVRENEMRALRTMPACEDHKAPSGRNIVGFCQTRDTGSLLEYQSRPDAMPEFSNLVAILGNVSSDFSMTKDTAQHFVLTPEGAEVPPDSPLLQWEDDKFLGEPYWLQGAEYQYSPDDTPMIAFLHIAYDGAPGLEPPPEALSRYGSGIIWLPAQWTEDRPFESQIKMTWDLG